MQEKYITVADLFIAIQYATVTNGFKYIDPDKLRSYLTAIQNEDDAILIPPVDHMFDVSSSIDEKLQHIFNIMDEREKIEIKKLPNLDNTIENVPFGALLQNIIVKSNKEVAKRQSTVIFICTGFVVSVILVLAFVFATFAT